MNILPHKSWHVRTKKNITRVRRDEERAKAEEDERQRRINLAEQEARIDALRSKRGHATSVRKAKVEAEPKSRHVDLFDNCTDRIGADTEKAAENKVEQEKWEVKAGIFSYLDGRYKHDNGGDEWYLRSRAERFEIADKSSAAIDRIKDDRAKQRYDPLQNMKSYLSQMKKREHSSTTLSSSNRECNETTIRVPKMIKIEKEVEEESSKSSLSSHRSKHKSKHKSKKRKHKKKSNKSSSSSEEESDSNSDQVQAQQSKADLIQRLRIERLEREKSERQRAQRLLNGPSAIVTTEPLAAKESQRYNSQFNPHIARQNQL